MQQGARSAAFALPLLGGVLVLSNDPGRVA